MRKTPPLLIAFLLLVGIYSCKKNELSKNFPTEQSDETLISAAKAFFDANVNSIPPVLANAGELSTVIRQNIHKTPLWNEAYVATKKDANIVVVPLKLDKNYITKQDDNPKHNVSLQKQTKLYIYKMGQDYKAIVVTSFPSPDYMDKAASKFSGIIFVEDWAGNSLYKLGVEDGKYYKITISKNTRNENKVERSTGKQSTIGTNRFLAYCYYRNHYMCSVDNNGNPYDCEYLYTEWIGCYEEPLHDELLPPDDGGNGGGEGGDIYLDDYQVGKNRDWLIAQEPVHHIGEIYGTTRLKGKRDSGEPQGGHFTGINHLYSVCNFCDINEVWIETSLTTNIPSPQAASINVTGRVNYSQGIFTLSGDKTWAFDDVF